MIKYLCHSEVAFIYVYFYALINVSVKLFIIISLHNNYRSILFEFRLEYGSCWNISGSSRIPDWRFFFIFESTNIFVSIVSGCRLILIIIFRFVQNSYCKRRVSQKNTLLNSCLLQLTCSPVHSLWKSW